jgi:hypothetical protein
MIHVGVFGQIGIPNIDWMGVYVAGLVLIVVGLVCGGVGLLSGKSKERSKFDALVIAVGCLCGVMTTWLFAKGILHDGWFQVIAIVAVIGLFLNVLNLCIVCISLLASRRR